MKKILSFLLLSISTSAAMAQDTPVEMADAMRSNGKIYVVVAVLLVIFIGIVIYLVKIDRKLSKLEREKGK